MPVPSERLEHAKSYLSKADDYLANAEVALDAGSYTPAGGDAIHAGINVKDAIVTALSGLTVKGKAHDSAVKELKQALEKRPETSSAERAMRDLMSSKNDVEYTHKLVGLAKAELLVRRARTLVSLAHQIVQPQK